MEEKGQLMGVPVKLVMALVIGTMVMGVMMQFVGTAERTVLKDMNVNFTVSGRRLTVKVYDAASNDTLDQATILVKYPGGENGKTLGTNTYQNIFTIPTNGEMVVVTVQVTRHGYIPWEGQAAVG